MRVRVWVQLGLGKITVLVDMLTLGNSLGQGSRTRWPFPSHFIPLLVITPLCPEAAQDFTGSSPWLLLHDGKVDSPADLPGSCGVLFFLVVGLRPIG